MDGVLKRYIFLLFLTLSLFGVDSLSARSNDGSRYTPNSVLSEGNWYKIKIPETGIYKLTYDDLKDKMGLENPGNVKIHGYGGWILEEDFSKPYVDDLPQVSIWMSNAPENFGKDDYILFYARGSVKWTYKKEIGEFEQMQNPYSNESYYFVTESPESPIQINFQESLAAESDLVSTFNDYVLHEQEMINVGETGRLFLGESFNSKTSQKFVLSTLGATNDPAIIRVNFLANLSFNGGQNLVIKLNNIREKTVYPAPKDILDSSDRFGIILDDTVVSRSLQNENILDLTFNKTVTSDKNLHLDFIRINYKRFLKPYGAVTLFRTVDSKSSNLTYQISEANNSILVFDVTGNTTVNEIETRLSGTVMSFTASNEILKEYALVDLSKIREVPTPIVSDKNDSRVGRIVNQNLHGKPVSDMVILVNSSLQTYAQELADLHEKNSELRVLVVNPEDIYNEFSSGKPDATAYRRFMKMFYDRAGGSDDRPQYLLLFGGGTYDNRWIEKRWSESQRKSALLTYQSEQSLSEIDSFVSDDYFGFLDDTSGLKLSNDQLLLGIGRLPVKDEQDASNVVEKIRTYMGDTIKGIWQSEFLFVADDLIGNKNNTNETYFINDSESLAKYVNTNYPDFTTSKIYEDAYERIVEANGARYPEATTSLLEKIENGVLVVNFMGHGTTRSWTHENLLTYSDIYNLKNDRLALWITATCDFSRYDGALQSAGELALLKKKGGAIALYSTVRLAYIFNNEKLNSSINKYLLRRDESGKPFRLGDIIRKAKLDLKNDENKLRFALLGDPALRLSFPDDTYTVQIVQVNGKDAGDEKINIEALSNTVIVGQVIRQNGDVVKNFNGVLDIVVFDSEQNLRTKGNKLNGQTDYTRGIDYKDHSKTLFSGKVRVTDGIFRIEFVSPKEIQSSNELGKMIFLAYDDDRIKKAQGSFSNYYVGGINPEVQGEFDGPIIEELFLNKRDFKSGDHVNSTPLFYAKVSDETGINLSNTAGSNISLTIDGKKEYNLTPYFESDRGNSTKVGSVSFLIPELEDGSHYLEFRIQDVWNTSTTSDQIHFVVADDPNSSPFSFDIWGNPAKDMTKFVFRTELLNDELAINLSVYSLDGKKMWIKKIQGDANQLKQYVFDWNLINSGGERLLPGVYICEAHFVVKGKTNTIKIQKLMVTPN